jgi:fructose-1-phosphate kinase PfkB-like protein
MDAYHLTNAALTAAGLRAVKGSLPTMDGPAFAADLARLKAAGTADELAFPEYDRAVTHDPLPGAVMIGPQHRIVLVEGLYLCRGKGAGGAAGEAWQAVRRSLDCVVMLEVPLSLCRARAAARKAAGGMAAGEAAAYFDRVDLPTYALLQEDRHKPVGEGPDLVLRIGGREPTAAAAAAAAAGSGSAPEPEPDLRLEAATLRVRSAARPAQLPAAKGADHQAHHPAALVVLGPNPCIQRTLEFDGGSRAGTGQPAVIRGQVNRATNAVVSVGGKGQHTAIAACRAISTAPTNVDMSVHLHQVQGGISGQQVHDMLTATVQSLEHPPQFLIHPVVLDGARPTRSCITVIDRSYDDSTELIEPAAPVTLEETASIKDEALGSVTTNLAKPCYFAMMGTCPPGADSMYRELLIDITSIKSETPLTVLLDSSKNVLPMLRTGGVSVLKVNADELAAIVGEPRSAGDDPIFEPAAQEKALRYDVVCAQALSLLLSSRHGALRTIAVTDGGRHAYLFSMVESTAIGSVLAAWQYRLGEIPADRMIRNSIGAGDTVAAVMLVHIARGDALEVAFARGLAAATASCFTLTGADWHQPDADVAFDNIVVSQEQIYI